MVIGKVRNLAVAALIGLPMLASAATQAVEVYKTATCGCCEEWVKHLQANAFKVNAHNVGNPSDTREKMGIPDRLGSCHTAIVGGYAIEGHVPAAEIKRLLAQKPKAKGLAVPAMPPGSPGMEGPTRKPYDVLLVRNDGTTTVYKHYN
ncbi:DUF411 domain-containing protein [Massilia sp.]|uniref:DUF411 domain-containing protein n=1 Tax=Massilia sp. TaxID=1882437 RepID=UPI00352CF13C